MDLLTIARRASLGNNTRTYFKNARDRLAIGSSYSKIVTACALDGSEHAFFESTYVIGLVAAAEALLTNLAMEYLVCYPARLNDQTLSLGSINEAGSIA